MVGPHNRVIGWAISSHERYVRASLTPANSRFVFDDIIRGSDRPALANKYRNAVTFMTAATS
jgi:hypothetical protein